MAESPWSLTAGGVLLSVRLTPKGGRDAIEGIDHLSDGSAFVKARVRAAPAGGEANAALIALLAEAIGVPRRNIELVGGAAARLKRLSISGDGPTLTAALAKIASAR